MAIPSFFKQNKPRGFNYRPRYYDPVKEELEQRRKVWAEEKKTGEEGGDADQSSSAEASEDGRSSSAEASDYVRRNGLSPSEPENAASQPYRSKIMRGDMKNYFNRRQEKVQKQTTIRLIVIILIIVLVAYLYLRF